MVPGRRRAGVPESGARLGALGLEDARAVAGVDAQLVDGPGQGELRAAQVLDEVPAAHRAPLLELGQHPVHAAEPCCHALGGRDRTGQHAVPVEQHLRQRVRQQRRVGLAHRQRGPAPAAPTRRGGRRRRAGDCEPGAAHGPGPSRLLRGAVGAAGAAEVLSQHREAVVRDPARPHQVPQHLEHRGRGGVGKLGDAGQEEPAGTREQVEDGAVQVGVERASLLEPDRRRQGERRPVRQVEAHEPVAAARAGQPRMPAPQHLAHGRQLVEQGGGVVRDTGRQHQGLEGRRRHRGPGELLDDPQHTVEAAQHAAARAARRRDPVPARQEHAERLGLDRLDLGPQRGERAAAQGEQHLGVAPLVAGAAERLRPQPPARQHAHRLEPRERLARDGDTEPEPARDVDHAERSVRARVPPQQVAERVGHGLGERLGHTHGKRHAERVPQAAGVLGDGPLLGVARGHARQPAEAHPDDAPSTLEVGQPADDLVADVFAGAGAQRLQRVGPRAAQHVPQVLGVAGLAIGRERLQLGLRALDRGRVEQVGELRRALVAEELRQQGGVERERGRAALGEGRVAVVQELCGVPEQQRLRERRGRRRRDLDEPHATRGEVGHEVAQRGDVEVVLQALARGLEHDREFGELGRDREQLRGPLTLLPQRLAPVRAASRQQQGARGRLPEAGGEHDRRAELVAHGVEHLVGVDQEILGRDAGVPGRHAVRRGAAGLPAGPRPPEVPSDVPGVGQPQHDPVVGVHRCDVEPVPLTQPRPDHERPRRVHARAERRVDHHAPVAELVAEALDDDGAVVGQPARRLALLGEVRGEVVGRPGVEPGVAQARAPEHRVGAQRHVRLPDERPDRAAELGGPPGGVALPEREPAGQAGCGRHEHPVGRDVLDAPRGRAKGERVAHAGLVDHLLVELAHALAPARRAALGSAVAREVDPVQATVRDRAAARGGEPQRPGASGEQARAAVPHDACSQLGEVLARVPAREHVEHGVPGGVAQRRERRRPADQGEQLVGLPVVDGERGHHLLGEDVERVGRDMEAFDLASLHPLRHHGGGHEVAAERREDDAARDRAHLVARATDALQAARDRRR